MGNLLQKIGKGVVTTAVAVEPCIHAMASTVEPPQTAAQLQREAQEHNERTEQEQHADEEPKVPAPREVRDMIVAATTNDAPTYHVGSDHAILFASTRLPFNPLNKYVERPVF